jgi:hypothetical protein
MPHPTSGQAPFRFALAPDLYTLPAPALAHEVKLHGGFAVDRRPHQGELYYGMPGVGLLRISPDLTHQTVIDLPPDVRDINFHSTKLGLVQGEPRLLLPANNAAFVAIATLDGQIEHRLTTPEFSEYQADALPYRPTDTAQDGDSLIITDGYGANFISTVNLHTHQWQSRFGGKSDDPHAHGRYGTAHGINFAPHTGHLAIADRPHSRIELVRATGEFAASHALPAGCKPCGIDFFQRNGHWYAVVGSLDDPTPGRPAPIYILDAETYVVIATVRPKEELGVTLADHIHNVIWHEHNGRGFLVCQAWNPGHYFVLELL